MIGYSDENIVFCHQDFPSCQLHLFWLFKHYLSTKRTTLPSVQRYPLSSQIQIHCLWTYSGAGGGARTHQAKQFDKHSIIGVWRSRSVLRNLPKQIVHRVA